MKLQTPDEVRKSCTHPEALREKCQAEHKSLYHLGYLLHFSLLGFPLSKQIFCYLIMHLTNVLN